MGGACGTYGGEELRTGLGWESLEKRPLEEDVDGREWI